MKKRTQDAFLAVTAIAVATACVAGHRPSPNLACAALPRPLAVATGEVAISCAWKDDFHWLLGCSVRAGGSEAPTQIKVVAFPGGPDTARSFDPALQQQYAGWDGCSVRLVDGRQLEEVSVVTPECDGAELVEEP